MVSFSLYMTQDFLENNVFKFFFNCDSQSNLRLKQNKMNAEYYKHPGTTTFLKRKMQHFKFYFLYFGFFHLSVRSHTWKTFG